MTATCPTHGTANLKQSNYGSPGTLYCTGTLPGNRPDGSPNRCAYKYKPETPHAAPQAPPVANGAPTTEQANPRLVAAVAALQAACTRFAGTPAPTNAVMQEALVYLNEFLRPAFKGELPATFVDPQDTEENPIPF